MRVVVFFFCSLFFHLAHSGVVLSDYWETRTKLIEESSKEFVGANLTLTTDEECVNQILMRHKNEEFRKGFEDPKEFLAAKHFFQARDGIRNSEVFKIIQKLPKGSSLHCHDYALVSDDFVFNLTYKQNLYAQLNIQTQKIKLHFYDPRKVPLDESWEAISEYRNYYPWFDEALMSQMTLVVDDPHKTYSDLNNIWGAFESIFGTISPVLSYTLVFKEYFYQALKELYEDNVRYLEFRGTLPQLYDLDGNTYGPEEVVGMYVDVLDEFKKHYPDFWDAKFIYAPPRGVDNATFEKYTEIFDEITRKYPDFVIGFDLVGQEDRGQPLISFIPQLLEMKNAPKFFHAGETNWFGEPTDLNLFDAILLNTTRIGHGYAIVKHPKIQQLVKERGIAIEIAPISNQVLKLVDDIRNHPGNILLANGVPVVITNDDPSFWGAKGLSYDWYVAFMGMANKEADLRLLKQLAINSIVYSGMNESERNTALDKWQRDWDRFIDLFLVE